MKTNEFAKLCGVDKRTLFYYDDIGLLKPAAVRENGYREYSELQLSRMEDIKLMQAADMTLKEIAAVLSSSLSVDEVRGVTADCCRRMEERAAELNDGISYMRHRFVLRDQYLEVMAGNEARTDITPENAARFSETPEERGRSHSEVRIFYTDFTSGPIDIFKTEYREDMPVGYLSTGYYLGVAESVSKGKPEFLFKTSSPERCDYKLPAGRFACAFYERVIGAGFSLPELVGDFAARLTERGRRFDDTVYCIDLPCWLVGKKDLIIYVFAALLKD